MLINLSFFVGPMLMEHLMQERPIVPVLRTGSEISYPDFLNDHDIIAS